MQKQIEQVRALTDELKQWDKDLRDLQHFLYRDTNPENYNPADSDELEEQLDELRVEVIEILKTTYNMHIALAQICGKYEKE